MARKRYVKKTTADTHAKIAGRGGWSSVVAERRAQVAAKEARKQGKSKTEIEKARKKAGMKKIGRPKKK